MFYAFDKKMSESVIEIQGMKNYLDGQWVYRDINLTVKQGEILAIIGGSGSGKTTLLRSVLMLLEPTVGSINVFGEEIYTLDAAAAFLLRRRWGVLFQHSALFSSLIVLENVMFPIHKFTTLDSEFMRELALFKIALVGLPYQINHLAAKLPKGCCIY